MKFKHWIQTQLPPAQARRVARTRKALLGWWHRDDLNYLARLFRTDKWGSHWYTQHYQRYFAPFKNKRINVLEIGVGGYENTGRGAASLRMWKRYFPKGQIVGIDLYDKRHLSESRVDVRKCDQTDANSLLSLAREYGGFDIIIDDGSHLNDDVIKTFLILFPVLRPNGIYAVEDMQTAYWPTWGGGIDAPRTSMAYFKRLVDGLNHAEYPTANYQPSYFDQHIVEIAFFHNLVVIRKGKNDEAANMPELIQREIEAGHEVAAEVTGG